MSPIWVSIVDRLAMSVPTAAAVACPALSMRSCRYCSAADAIGPMTGICEMNVMKYWMASWTSVDAEINPPVTSLRQSSIDLAANAASPP
ncbi:hypothetical protein A4G28_04525 [Mycobacterium ostraviense]|uniref:Uncharacterized protein n=1 Tax=Mycobacterium ostraviense TaxID=2738409 RepID=A0A164B4B6_9MYCO|nr:hypothetical protein A4G28_04525 [Mycobacterium ostraviense]